jgi:DNA-binding GntR family transcriptional regulator
MTPDLEPKAQYAYQRVRCERDYRRLIARHWEFLETLYSAAGMPQLTQLISSLRIQTALIPERAKVRAEIVKIINAHDPLLLEACRNNDANAAERIIREHIAALEKAVTAPATRA